MNNLDDRLDAAAADLRRALDAVTHSGATGVLDRRDRGADPTLAWQANERPSRRNVGSIAAAAVLVAGVVGLYVVQTRPGPSNSDHADAPVVSDPGPPPLQLLTTPSGYLLGASGLSQLTGDQFASAVFVHRDVNGSVTGKLTARAGAAQNCAANSPHQLGIESVVSLPSNLPTVTSGHFYADSQFRHLSLGYVLGAAGQLCLDMFNADASTDSAAAETMQAIAAALTIGPGNTIGVQAPLPQGWVLAAPGPEPSNIKTFYQGYSTSLADRQVWQRLTVSHIYTGADGLRFWLTDETLQPVTVRGHQGYVTAHRYVPGENAWGGGVEGGRIDVHTLMWQENPGTWTTLRGDDMSTDQLLALADQLVSMPPDQWQQLAAAPFTTTPVAGPESSNSVADRATDGVASTAAPTAPGSTTRIAYSIQSGDTLLGIAAAHGITVDQIVAANEWTNGIHHIIHQDDTILIPALPR